MKVTESDGTTSNRTSLMDLFGGVETHAFERADIHVLHHLHERVPRICAIVLVKLHKRTFEHAGQVEVVVSIKAQR